MANPPIWPVQPIWNASSVPLSEQPGTLPMFADVVASWFQLLTFEIVTKTVVNFQVVETTTPMNFQGVVVDDTRKLDMQPHGQRLWKHKSLYCWPTVLLAPDDVVKYQGDQYRVLERRDFKEYGIVQYVLTQDFTGAGPVGG
jgi:hypothetical protein